MRVALCVPLVISLAACDVLVPNPSAATPPAFEYTVLSGSGDEPAPVQKVLQLAAGNYVVEWEAQQPLQPGWRTCDVALDLLDSDGESVMGGGISEHLEEPTAGHAQMRDLPAGHYTLWTDFGCPFRVTLSPY